VRTYARDIPIGYVCGIPSRRGRGRRVWRAPEPVRVLAAGRGSAYAAQLKGRLRDHVDRFLAATRLALSLGAYGISVKLQLGRKTVTGSLPWGYRKGEDGVAQPDPERAPYVRRIFELYASGRHTEIRDLHQPLVDEELFDRVQDLRRAGARTIKPGRPSARYLLRGLAHCGRCQAKMQGTATGRQLEARDFCSGRRNSQGCDQPTARAAVVEEQLVEFVSDFKPEPLLREEILRRLAAGNVETKATARKRAVLEERLRRLRDLYELSDVDRNEYLARRQEIQLHLAELGFSTLDEGS
jgi:hypothetical protein